MSSHKLGLKLTPCSIMAILSARRAVAKRCVMNMTVFFRSPLGRDICSIVSKTCFCACASREAVCGSAVVMGRRPSRSSAGRGGVQEGKEVTRCKRGGNEVRTGSSKTRSSTSERCARMNAREMAIRCHWSATCASKGTSEVSVRLLERSEP